MSLLGGTPFYDGIGGGRRSLAWQVGNPGAVAALGFAHLVFMRSAQAGAAADATAAPPPARLALRRSTQPGVAFVGDIVPVDGREILPIDVLLALLECAALKDSAIEYQVVRRPGLRALPLRIEHPFWMLLFLLLTAVTFSLLGFIIGIWADGFEKLQIVPMLILTPLTFLGGTFYSIDMLPGVWKQIALVNPVVYLVSGFRWSFYGISDVGVGLSLGMTFVFMLACLAAITWIFRTGYRLKV